MSTFQAADRALLMRLLRMPTVCPLEVGAQPGVAPPQLRQAQLAYAHAAAELGCTVLHHGVAHPAELDRPDVPPAARAAAAEDPEFLSGQPSLVLRLGPPRSKPSTVMFNVHLDTVAGEPPVGFTGTRFHGRGAITAKGPAVALLAGIRAAMAADPAIGRDVSVLIQAVSGKEGGAMGTYGTRRLVERGFVGGLNVFCEPTGLRYLTRATASATARIRVRGRDAAGDRPERGHNASVLLGYLAQWLALALSVDEGGAGDGRACVAGLHTGHLHNRVYGTGCLLVDLAYATGEAGRTLEHALTDAVRDGVADFSRRFARVRELATTAAAAAELTSVDWLTRGLPTLSASSARVHELMAAAGIKRWPDGTPAFTCDAIWMSGVPGTDTIVLGPGGPDTNNAHGDGEFADIAELAEFADTISRLLRTVAARTQDSPPHDRIGAR